MFHFFVIWAERQISKYVLKVDPDGFTIVVITIFFTIFLAHISKNYFEKRFINIGRKIKLSKD